MVCRVRSGGMIGEESLVRLSAQAGFDGLVYGLLVVRYGVEQVLYTCMIS